MWRSCASSPTQRWTAALPAQTVPGEQHVASRRKTCNRCGCPSALKATAKASIFLFRYFAIYRIIVSGDRPFKTGFAENAQGPWPFFFKFTQLSSGHGSGRRVSDVNSTRQPVCRGRRRWSKKDAVRPPGIPPPATNLPMIDRKGVLAFLVITFGLTYAIEVPLLIAGLRLSAAKRPLARRF